MFVAYKRERAFASWIVSKAALSQGYLIGVRFKYATWRVSGA